MPNLYGKLNLSRIPKEMIVTEPNGDKTIKIDVCERRQASEWGHTHYITTKGQPDPATGKPAKIYLCDLKASQYQPDRPCQPYGQQPQPQGLPQPEPAAKPQPGPVPEQPKGPADDLPF